MKIKYTKVNKGRYCPTLNGSMGDWPPRIIRRPFMHHLFKGSDGSFNFIKPKNRKSKVVYQ